MKTLSIILLACLAFAALVMAAYLWQIQTADDPLASDKVELQRVRLLKDIESLQLAQERERQTSAKLAAKLAKERAEQERQATIQSTPLVVTSRTLAAAAWPVLPLFLLGSAMTGGLVYAFVRRTTIETPFVKASLPVRSAAAIVERSLQVSNSAEMARSLAYTEEISRARMNDTANMVKAFKGIAGRENVTINNALPEHIETTAQAGNLPTFAEIFDSRELHGEMILGYEDEETPRTGHYEAVHSCLIYGVARSGKTSFLRGITGQTILTEPNSRFFTLDPHGARKDSLLGSLPNTHHFKAVDAEHPEPTLQALRDELRRRLLSDDDDFPPYILLIDELNELARREYKPLLVKTCEEIAQQGRKVKMFLLCAAQDLRQKKIGDFRDSLSSAYFFKGKSSQVKAFLDDNDAAKLYRQNVNRHGVALFSAADEEPKLMLIPECKPDDLQQVERTLKNHCTRTQQAVRQEISLDAIEETNDDSDGIQTNVERQASNVILFPNRRTEPTNQLTTAAKPDTFDAKTLRESAGLSQGKFAELTKCSLSKLKRVETGGGSFDADEIAAILTNLNAWQKSSEPANQLRTNGEPNANQTRTETEPTNHTCEA